MAPAPVISFTPFWGQAAIATLTDVDVADVVVEGDVGLRVAVGAGTPAGVGAGVEPPPHAASASPPSRAIKSKLIRLRNL